MKRIFNSLRRYTQNIKLQKWASSTYIKYLLSYLIILTLLIIGFFFIIRSQLSEKYYAQRLEQSKMQLDSFVQSMNSDLISLQQTDSSIQYNSRLVISSYLSSATYRLEASKELTKYDTASRLINSIVFLPKSSSQPIKSNISVSYKDNIFYLSDTPFQDSIAFDPAPYLDTSSSQLIYLANEDLDYLLYFPELSSQHAYLFFYILDREILGQQLYKLSSEEMPAIALFDPNGQCAIDINASELAPYLNCLPAEDGIYHMDDSTSLYIKSDLKSGFSLAALLSNQFILNQINSSFSSAYLTLTLLGLAGFILIQLAMRLTYQPLYRLTTKLVPDLDFQQSYLDQLDNVYSRSDNQILELQSKLDNYRLSIQKSLLDSIVSNHNPNKSTMFSGIDHLFDPDSDKEIFMIQVGSENLQESMCWTDIRDYYQNLLPDTDTCIMLDVLENNSALFLISYVGTQQHKEEMLLKISHTLYEERGYLTAISNSSSSPMDIPSLYENVLYASSCWPEIPVIAFSSLPAVPSAYSYPHDQLNQLTKSLEENNFPGARALLENLFQITNNAAQFISENNLSDFFVHAILVDILTIIINYMNLSYIKFNIYSDLYFETLYYCRSCPYNEKSKKIIINVEKLIDICEQEISKKLLNSSEFLQLIEESYCNPDFSISMLADQLHVNYYYMSQLFKKEMKISFSDYIWTLRLKKAKNLLRNTELSIDEISAAVGYFNSSSFRRKFKVETGMTPSQFRDTPDAE